MEKKIVGDIYEDMQNMIDKMDIQHNQLRISNDVINNINKLKEENKYLNKEILKYKKTLNDLQNSYNEIN